MPEEKLVWKRKRPIKIGGKTVKNGQEFSVHRKAAHTFRLLGYAEDAPKAAPTYQRRDMRAVEQVRVAPTPVHTWTDQLHSARAEYERKTGQKPDLRWGIVRLKEEIANANA